MDAIRLQVRKSLSGSGRKITSSVRHKNDEKYDRRQSRSSLNEEKEARKRVERSHREREMAKEGKENRRTERDDFWTDPRYEEKLRNREEVADARHTEEG